MPVFIRHLRIKKDLYRQVAQLSGQLPPVAIVDGLQDLVGFLERIALDGIESLFSVPGTAFRSAQPCHDGNSLLEFLPSGHSFNVSLARRTSTTRDRAVDHLSC